MTSIDPDYPRKWQIANREKCAAATRRWRERHPGKNKALAAALRAANPKKQTHDQAMRRAKAHNAVPSWADRQVIRKIYDNCPDGLEVDHIVPLKHEKACGLHVPWNLQYLTRSENARKNSNADLETLP